MNPFQALLKAVAPIIRPIVNVVNAVIQAVAPKSSVAQASQAVTNTVNAWTAPNSGSSGQSSSSSYPTSSASSNAARTSGNEVEPVSPAANTPRYTREQQRQAELNERSQTFETQQQGPSQQGKEYIFNPINALLTFTFAAVDDYFTPVAAKLKNLNDTRIKIFMDVLYVNEGDIPKTVEQIFSGLYADMVTQRDIDTINDMLNAHQSMIGNQTGGKPPHFNKTNFSLSNSPYVQLKGNGDTNSLGEIRRFSQEQTATPIPGPFTAFDPTAKYLDEAGYLNDEGEAFLKKADDILVSSSASENEKMQAQAVLLQLKYGVNITVNPRGTSNGVETWKTYLQSEGYQNPLGIMADRSTYLIDRVNNIYQAVQMVESALQDQSLIRSLPAYMQPWFDSLDLSNPEDQGKLFHLVMGDVNIQLSAGAGIKSETIGSSIVLHDATYQGVSSELIIPIPLIIHELGHVFHNRIIDPTTANSSDPKKYLVERMSDEGLKSEKLTLYPSSKEEQRGYSLHTPSGVMPYNSPLDAKEAFADSFLFWVYDRYAGTPPVSSGLIEDTQDLGGFTKDDAGNLRRHVMTQWLADEVTILYGRSNPQTVRNVAEQTIQGELFSVSAAQDTYLREHPSSQPIIPSNLAVTGVTNFTLSQLNPATNLKAIGQVSTQEGTWILVELNGNVGWISADMLREVPFDLPPLTSEQVVTITGRNYTTEWIPKPTVIGLGG